MAIALAELQRPLNVDDYLNSPEDAERFEVINGEMFEVSPPNAKHGWVVQALNFSLGRVILGHQLGMIYVAPFGVRLSDTDILEPDLFFVSNARRGLMTEMYFDGPPDLVVEVLSPSSRRVDLIRKMATYQRAGVAEYWIADPQEETIRVFVLTDGRFIEQSNAEGRAVSAVIPGVEIEVSSVFAGAWPVS